VTALYKTIAESIADGMRKFIRMSRQELDTMGENGRTFYQQELALAVGTKQFAGLFESVIQ
jgi:hypothetical protein